MKKNMVFSYKNRRAIDSAAIELMLEAVNGKGTTHAVISLATERRAT